jgi:hypothetical protein
MIFVQALLANSAQVVLAVIKQDLRTTTKTTFSQVIPLMESEAFCSRSLNESLRILPISPTDQRFLEQAAGLQLRKTSGSAFHRSVRQFANLSFQQKCLKTVF